MKVCHLTSVHGQEDTRIFHKECISLVKAGHDVYEISRGKTYDKNGVHIVGIDDFKAGRINRMLGLVRKVYIKALEIDADVYHAHDPELLPVLMKLKNKRKKTIFDSHEHTVGAIQEKTYLPTLFRSLIGFSYEQYQTYVCHKMDAVITATPNIAEYFQSKGCKRVIDICNFPLLNNDFKEPEYSSRTISFAGGLSGQWNHNYIINAIGELNNVRYLLCGSDGSYVDSLRQLPGWKNVDFKGRLPFEQVAELLRCSAIGVSILTPGANTDWNNGNMANTKIFEQMMAGLPVVCTNFVRWRKFVEGYDCGICVNPHDIAQIREAIRQLVDNPDFARKKGLNGRQAIEKEFNWGKEEKKLLTLYEEIGGENYHG